MDRAVQALKYELSHRDTARFQFRDDHIDLDIAVTRAQLELWIRDELEQHSFLYAGAGLIRDRAS